MFSKKIILPAVALAATGIIAIGATQVHAQTNNGPFSGLVQMIAKEFNLDQSKVQSVFDQYRSQQQTLRTDRINTRLDQFVATGKITASQKQAILDKLAKLKSEFSPQSLRGMTPAQRKDAFQKRQAEILAFAKSQNIDPKYLTGLRFGMHGHWWLTATPTPTP